MKRLLQLAAGFALVGALISGGHLAVAQPATPPPDPGEVSAVVDHPLFPLASVPAMLYAGEQRDPETGESIATRVEHRVLPNPEQVAGMEVTVVEVKEYEDGDLVELTHDYYVQNQDGDVFYVGERVDDYEDGRVVGHSGEWLAGEGENRAGLFMPRDLVVGQTFSQEWAPGIAEDNSTVLALAEEVTTPAGAFTDCLQTEDVNPLDGDTEFKFYCPGVGLVREESDRGRLDLVSFEMAAGEGTPVSS